MNRSKTALVLSATSLVLLVVLQLLWLHNSYEKARLNFHARCSDILRTTVTTLRDSAFIRSIETVQEDSASENLALRGIRMHWSDTLGGRQTYIRRSSKVEVIAMSSEQKDSLRPDVMRIIAPRLQQIRSSHDPEEKVNFIVRLGPDTLSIDSIARAYRKNLGARGISNRFTIHKQQQSEFLPDRLPFEEHNSRRPLFGQRLFSDSLSTELSHVNPFVSYEAHITGVRATVGAEIAPQLSFAAFVTLITFVSFVSLFKNARSQQRLLAMKNDFVSNMTHELKTPISTVSVALEALKNFDALKNPQIAGEYLDMAQRELGRLTMLTDNILKSSILENKRLIVTNEIVDLKALINQVMSSLRFVFEKAHAEVSVELPSGKCTVLGDPTHLTNMIFNIVDNALKYSKGAPVIRVELSCEEGAAQLRITDEGVGIPQAYHKKVFEKFFRVPQGNVHTVKGHGLGLNYVDSIVREHKGTIDLKSEEGKGTSFTVRLPMNAV